MAYDTLTSARYWEQMAREKAARDPWMHQPCGTIPGHGLPIAPSYRVPPSPDHNVTVTMNTPADVARLKQDLQAMSGRVLQLSERITHLECSIRELQASLDYIMDPHAA